MSFTIDDFTGEYANRRLEASLNRFLSLGSSSYRSSRVWEYVDGDHRAATVIYKPLNLQMRALAYAPFKYTINKPSVKEAN